MNRNTKEKESHHKNDYDNIKYIEPIPPKFNVNWSQNIRFDKIMINVSGTFSFIKIVSTKLFRGSPRNSSGKSKRIPTHPIGMFGGPIGLSVPRHFSKWNTIKKLITFLECLIFPEKIYSPKISWEWGKKHKMIINFSHPPGIFLSSITNLKHILIANPKGKVEPISSNQSQCPKEKGSF